MTSPGSSARTPSGAGCSSRAARPACTCRSTTARPGSGSRGIYRRCRCTTSSSRRTISSPGPTDAGSGSSTTSARSVRAFRASSGTRYGSSSPASSPAFRRAGAIASQRSATATTTAWRAMAASPGPPSYARLPGRALLRRRAQSAGRRGRPLSARTCPPRRGDPRLRRAGAASSGAFTSREGADEPESAREVRRSAHLCLGSAPPRRDPARRPGRRRPSRSSHARPFHCPRPLRGDGSEVDGSKRSASFEVRTDPRTGVSQADLEALARSSSDCATRHVRRTPRSTDPGRAREARRGSGSHRVPPRRAGAFRNAACAARRDRGRAHTGAGRRAQPASSSRRRSSRSSPDSPRASRAPTRRRRASRQLADLLCPADRRAGSPASARGGTVLPNETPASPSAR